CCNVGALRDETERFVRHHTLNHRRNILLALMMGAALSNASSMTGHDAESLGAPLTPAFEVPQHRQIAATPAPNCPQAPAAVMALTAGSPYSASDPSASIINPANEANVTAQMKPVWNFACAVALWANRYLSNPAVNGAAGLCALRLLDAWASANALSRIE